MALEVGTLQGGQIAALQDGKEGSMGEPWVYSLFMPVLLFFSSYLIKPLHLQES